MEVVCLHPHKDAIKGVGLGLTIFLIGVYKQPIVSTLLTMLAYI